MTRTQAPIQLVTSQNTRYCKKLVITGKHEQLGGAGALVGLLGLCVMSALLAARRCHTVIWVPASSACHPSKTGHTQRCRPRRNQDRRKALFLTTQLTKTTETKEKSGSKQQMDVTKGGGKTRGSTHDWLHLEVRSDKNTTSLTQLLSCVFSCKIYGPWFKTSLSKHHWDRLHFEGNHGDQTQMELLRIMIRPNNLWGEGKRPGWGQAGVRSGPLARLHS